MTNKPDIITAYHFPFTVLHHPAPLFQGEYNVSLRAFPQHAVNQEMIDGLDALLMQFYMLASTGTLGGDTVAPWDSGVKNLIKPTIRGESIEWVLQGCDLDERAAVILAQLFLMTQDNYPLYKLVISKDGNMAGCIPLAHDPDLLDPYPAIYPAIPFSSDIDKDAYDTRSLYIQFKRRLNSEEEKAIDVEILTWATSVAMGAYGVAPVSPDFCSIIPDESIVFLGDELEWSMNKFRAHHSALNGLINLCGAIDHNIAAIEEVVIE